MLNQSTYLFTSAVIALIAICASPQSAVAGSTTVPNETLSQLISDQISSAQSIHSLSANIRVTTVNFSHDMAPHATLFVPNTNTYQWAIKGSNFYVRYIDNNNAYNENATPTTRMPPVTITNFSDHRYSYLLNNQAFAGKRITYGNRTAASDIHANVLKPLNPLSFNGTFIANILQNNPPYVLSSYHDTHFGNLEVVSYKLKEGGDGGLYFSTNYKGVALRLDHRWPVKGGVWRLNSYKVTRVRKVGTVWLAAAGVVDCLLVSNGQVTKLMHQDLDFSKITINSIPDTLFSPKFVSGTIINDMDAKTRYGVGANGKLFRDGNFSTAPVFTLDVK